jgi:hypothetical protein
MATEVLSIDRVGESIAPLTQVSEQS